MSAEISASDVDFTPAVAGTVKQQAGTDGKFKAVVTLDANGITKEAEISGVVKAAAYTAPVQDP